MVSKIHETNMHFRIHMKKQQSGESWCSKFCDADTVQASSKYKVLLNEIKRDMNLILQRHIDYKQVLQYFMDTIFLYA